MQFISKTFTVFPYSRPMEEFTNGVDHCHQRNMSPLTIASKFYSGVYPISCLDQADIIACMLLSGTQPFADQAPYIAPTQSIYWPYIANILTIHCPYIVHIWLIYCPYIGKIFNIYCPYIPHILSNSLVTLDNFSHVV